MQIGPSIAQQAVINELKVVLARKFQSGQSNFSPMVGQPPSTFPTSELQQRQCQTTTQQSQAEPTNSGSQTVTTQHLTASTSSSATTKTVKLESEQTNPFASCTASARTTNLSVLEQACKDHVQKRQDSAFSKESYNFTLNRILQAAVEASNITKPMGSTGKTDSNRKHTTECRDKILAEIERCSDGPDSIPPKEFSKNIKRFSKQMLVALKKDKLPTAAYKRAFSIDLLEKNESLWKPWSQTLEMRPLSNGPGNKGAPQKFQCTVSTVIDQDAHSEGRYGRSSNDRACPHLVNSRVSTLEMGGKTIISFARTGCTRGRPKATEDLVATALTASMSSDELSNDLNALRLIQEQDSKIQQNSRQKPTTAPAPPPSLASSEQSTAATPRGTQSNPFPLRMSNIQLMSPGFLFGALDEKLPFQQAKGLEELAKKTQPVEITIQDPKTPSVFVKIWVKLDPPLVFNFGCNGQHFSRAIRLRESSTRSMNETSMKRLFGNELVNLSSKNLQLLQSFNRGIQSSPFEFNAISSVFGEKSIVGDFLKDPKNSPKDKKIVLQLASQIVDIWQSQAYNTNARNPYAIQERLAVLSHKLGYTPSINCKSGKDRTGMVCGQINTLAAEIEMSGNDGVVPFPYASLSMEHIYNSTHMLEASGSSYVTTGCNGLKGLKIIEFGDFQPSSITGKMQGTSHLASS